MDEDVKGSVKQVIQQWIGARHQALLEQVMMTWEEGMGRFTPDEALLDKIQAATAPPEMELIEDPFPDVVSDTENELGVALDLIEQAISQGEVLKNLLEGLQPFVERSALFVVKQGIASLYAARGFEPDAPKFGAPVVPPPELEPLVQGKGTSLAGPGPAYKALLAPLSRFEAQQSLVVPLRLRRRVVGLLLVDSGTRQTLDHPNHVRALVRVAEACLSSLAGLREEEKTNAGTEPAPSMVTQRVPEPLPEPTAPALDPKLRANAERSARVLVGDVELYFPAKVAQGKQRGNVYALLREELDRSRASFVERYGAELEEKHQIFYQTVVQQLCDGEAKRLGPAPWAPMA